VQIVLPEPATPTPRPTAAATAQPVVRGTQRCVADTPGRAFAAGTVDDRSSAFNAFLAANPGSSAALVVSENDLASALADAVKQSPVSIRDVSARIDASKVRITGQALQFGTGVDVQLGIRYGRLDLSFRIDGVPEWARDQLPSPSTWLEAMNAGPARWQRVVWREGCLALVGTGTGSAPSGAPPAPAPSSAPPAPGTSPATPPPRVETHPVTSWSGVGWTMTEKFTTSGAVLRWEFGEAPTGVWLFVMDASTNSGSPVCCLGGQPARGAASVGPGTFYVNVQSDGRQIPWKLTLEEPGPAPAATPAKTYVPVGSWEGTLNSTAGPMETPVFEVGEKWRLTWDLAGQPKSIRVYVYDASGRLQSFHASDQSQALAGNIVARGIGTTVVQTPPGKYKFLIYPNGDDQFGLFGPETLTWRIEVADLR